MKSSLIKLHFVNAIIFSVIVLGGCNNANNPDNIDYIAVNFEYGDSQSIIDKNGKIVVKEEYPADNHLSYIVNGVYWVNYNGKYQLYHIDNPKIPVNDKEYSSATRFRHGVAVVSNPNKPIQLIDEHGVIVTTLPNEIVQCYELNDDGYGIIQNKEGKYGVINNKGQVIITPKFSYLTIGTKGILLTENDNDKNYSIRDINEKKLGQFPIDKYELITDYYSEDKIIVKKKSDKNGFLIVLDKTGKELFNINKAIYCIDPYKNGFLAFCTEDEKYGLVDNKGNIVIRPKYERLENLGNGQFAAMKNDKWGVVDTKDNNILDFISECPPLLLGQNYIIYNYDKYRLYNKSQRVLTSFEGFSFLNEAYVEYVNLYDLVDQLYNSLNPYEKGLTAKQIAQRESLEAENHKRDYIIHSLIYFDNKFNVLLTSRFLLHTTMEVTHQETKDDGWFAQTYTVSDGWKWTDEYPYRIEGTLSLNNHTLNIKDIYNTILEKIPAEHTKISDGVYSIRTKIDGSTVESKMRFTLEDNKINVLITF